MIGGLMCGVVHALRVSSGSHAHMGLSQAGPHPCQQTAGQPLSQEHRTPAAALDQVGS